MDTSSSRCTKISPDLRVLRASATCCTLDHQRAAVLSKNVPTQVQVHIAPRADELRAEPQRRTWDERGAFGAPHEALV